MFTPRRPDASRRKTQFHIQRDQISGRSEEQKRESPASWVLGYIIGTKNNRKCKAFTRNSRMGKITSFHLILLSICNLVLLFPIFSNPLFLFAMLSVRFWM